MKILTKSEYSSKRDKFILDKICLNIEDDKEIFNSLVKKISKYDEENAEIMNILFYYDKKIVLKFDNVLISKYEYEYFEKIINLNNFINYYCNVKFNDEIDKYFHNLLSEKFFKKNINYFIVMKYYELGSIYTYPWTKNNFNVLKNVIKQTLYTLIQLNNTYGYIYINLHCANVLLKYKLNKYIIYDKKKISILKYEVLINDYDKIINHIQLKQNNILLIQTIYYFLNSICDNNIFTLRLDYDYKKLLKLNNLYNINMYNEINKIINTIIIL